MSSSPGILDGDEYDITIEVAENCSLQLHTQSYQRLFTMKEKATQQMQVHLMAGAGFSFIPHPVVPHEQSHFIARNRIYLSRNCDLIFGEILTCGRKLNNEIFLLSKYHNITEIFMDDKLVVKENVLMQPAVIDINAIGQLQGFTHQASLIYLSGQANVKEVIADITDMLSLKKDISVGITAAPINGVIIRILGQKAEQLFDCLKQVAGRLPMGNQHKITAYGI